MHKIFYTAALLLLTAVSSSQNIALIPGWTVVKTEAASTASVQLNADGMNTAVYAVQKQVTGNGAVEDWFGESIEEDMRTQQWTEAHKGSSTAASDIYVYVTEVMDKDHKQWYLLYMGYGFGKDQMRLARVTSTHDQNFFQLAGKQASKHFGQLASQDMKGNNTVSETKTTPAAPEKKPAKNTTIEIAATGKGVKSADIHSVIMHLEYEGGIGGGIYPVYNAYVLFKMATFINTRW